MNTAANPPVQKRPMGTATPRKGLSGKTIVALILLALSLAFVFSNLGAGAIMFLGFRFVMPVWIWFLAVLVVGVIIGSLFPWFHTKKRK